MFPVVRRKGCEVAEWQMRQSAELTESGEAGDEAGTDQFGEAESEELERTSAGALDLKADGRRRDEGDEDEDEDDEDPDVAFDELDEDKELDDKEDDLDDYDDEEDSDEEDSEDEEH